MNRNLTLVAVSLFAWGIGEGLFIYFQPLYLQEWGADPLLIGAIFSAMGIAMAASQIPAGYLSDRFGSRNIMFGSWFIGTIAAWFMALAGSMPMFVAGIVMYGLTGFVVAPMNSYITSVRGKWSVGRALTFTSGLYNLGAVLGPVTGGLIADKLGLQAVYRLAGVIFIISTVIVLFADKNTEVHHEDVNSNNKLGLLKNYRFLAFLGLAFVTFFALYLPQPLTPNFLQNEQGFSRTTIGILGALGSLGNAVAMLTLGHLPAVASFLIGQAWVLVFSALFLTGTTPVWFGLGYFFIGGYRLCRSMVIAIARPLINPRQTGLAYGMIETSGSFAIIIAPVLAGLLYKKQPSSVYSTSILLISLVIVLNVVIFSIIRKRNNNHATED